MDVARQAEMLANRVRKNFRRLRGPFERRGVGAFRVYDWDVPEVRAAIDWYEGHLVVAEYAREQTRAVGGWLPAMARAAAEALDVPADRVHLKERHTGAGTRYGRLAQTDSRLAVRELGLRFWVNLDDYIDTGLFADHRDTRARLRAEARGATFLNLFGYTGSFTCAAAAGGASRTVTVDASSSRLSWAGENLELNQLGGAQHELVRADAREFLARSAQQGRFTLCFLDPPSFSARAGARSFDVQRDHRSLVEQTLRVLQPGGVLYFSTNHQRFEPDLAELGAEEITKPPPDYRRTPHRLFRLERPATPR
jgi:23S rRNA G2069 N7-methylase RlmK/C1962 C5-methylase RlmI